MRRLRSTFVLPGLLVLLASTMWSQPAVPAPAGAYAKEPVVLERLSRTERLNSDGTGVRTDASAIRIQSTAALRQFSVVTIGFASQSQKPQFDYVRVRHPDGSVTDTALSSAQEQPLEVTRVAPFYSDLKQLQLPVKNLQVGDTLEWKATETTFKPEAPDHLWGDQTFVSSGLVVLAQDFTLDLPKGTAVNVWVNPRWHGGRQETTEGDRHVYRWTDASLEPTVGAAAEQKKAEADKQPLTPDEALDEKDGRLPDVAWTTFADWNAVGAWFSALTAGRDVADDAIRAKVEQLTHGKTSTEEKVRAIYSYVALQIHYIGVSFGVGRYQPHAASAVLEDQYGDCKDKHTLLAAMLKVVGVEPSAVLVGAGIRFNPAIPSPAAFNHLITRIELEGKPIWLDTTAEVAPFGMLQQPTRDKPVLRILQAGGQVEQTPATLPFAPFFEARVDGTLGDDLTSESDFTLTFHSDDELALREVLRNISAAQYEEFVQRLMGGFGFGGTTTAATIGPVDDVAVPEKIAFHYHRVKQEEWGADRVTVPFLPISLPAVDESKPPRTELQLGLPRTESTTVSIKLPPGWSANPPDAVHEQSAFATCDTVFQLADGRLTALRRIVVLKSTVPVSEWRRYKRWYDSAAIGSVPFLQLKPPKGLRRR